jgi:hypothetical protein
MRRRCGASSIANQRYEAKTSADLSLTYSFPKSSKRAKWVSLSYPRFLGQIN